MKVLHIITGLGVGGAELMLSRLILSHSNLDDIEHVIISLTSKDTLGLELESKGLQVYALGIFSIVNAPLGLLKLWRLIKSVKPDIVQTWLYHADFIGGIVARFCGIKNIIWSVRSTDITKGGARSTIFIRWCCARLSKIIPKLILFAAYTSRIHHENLGYDKKKSKVIANGFNLDEILRKSLLGISLKEELEILESDKVVISVGRYHPVKDHKTFIAAAAKIMSEHKGVKFVLVGRDVDSSNQELTSCIKKTGKSGSFYLLGQQSNIPLLLNNSDVFCLHSVTEGFPNVLGEAMSLGLPCITTDVGDAAYLLNQPRFVATPGSVESLFLCLDDILKLSDIERQKIGNESALRIRKFFCMSKISERYRVVYNSLPI